MKKVKILGKSIPILVLVLLGVGLVSAALLTYYGTMNATINVEQALYLESNNVQLMGTYNYVVGLDGWTCVDDSVHGKYCSATISTLSGNAVIFRADVVNKIQNDINWNRLITVKRTDAVAMVAGEAFVSYAYPANWNHASDIIGTVDGCWEASNYGSGSNAWFRTAIASELPKVTVGGYDGHATSPTGGYEMCVEHTESTTITDGKLTWNGGVEPAYGIVRCGIDNVDDSIGCMPTGTDYTNPVSYDRPSYIIVEFPLNTVGSYIVNFHMVPITV